MKLSIILPPRSPQADLEVLLQRHRADISTPLESARVPSFAAETVRPRKSS